MLCLILLDSFVAVGLEEEGRVTAGGWECVKKKKIFDVRTVMTFVLVGGNDGFYQKKKGGHLLEIDPFWGLIQQLLFLLFFEKLFRVSCLGLCCHSLSNLHFFLNPFFSSIP